MAKKDKHDDADAKGEKVGVLRHRAPERVILEDKPPAPSLEPSPEAEKLMKRQADVQARLKDSEMPDSMKAAILMGNVDDDEIDRMEKEWKDGKVVTLGERRWGEEKA